MVISDARATKRVLRQIAASFAALNFPARVRGAIRARQRISSAIQFPTPGNPFWRRSTALIGAR